MSCSFCTQKDSNFHSTVKKVSLNVVLKGIWPMTLFTTCYNSIFDISLRQLDGYRNSRTKLLEIRREEMKNGFPKAAAAANLRWKEPSFILEGEECETTAANNNTNNNQRLETVPPPPPPLAYRASCFSFSWRRTRYCTRILIVSLSLDLSLFRRAMILMSAQNRSQDQQLAS